MRATTIGGRGPFGSLGPGRSLRRRFHLCFSPRICSLYCRGPFKNGLCIYGKEWAHHPRSVDTVQLASGTHLRPGAGAWARAPHNSPGLRQAQGHPKQGRLGPTRTTAWLGRGSFPPSPLVGPQRAWARAPLAVASPRWKYTCHRRCAPDC